MRLIIILLLMITIVLSGKNSFPVMMKVKSKEKIQNDFRLGVAEAWTNSWYEGNEQTFRGFRCVQSL